MNCIIWLDIDRVKTKTKTNKHIKRESDLETCDLECAVYLFVYLFVCFLDLYFNK